MNSTFKRCIVFLCLISCYFESSGQEHKHLPYPSFKGHVVVDSNFTLFYVEKHEQAAFVAYELAIKDAFSLTERTDDFRIDTRIPTGSATLEDYRGSGYDRGHQIPAGDAKASTRDMSATFVLSNMSPQLPDFNRRTMRLWETLVRDLLKKEERLYVVTGPIFKDNLGSIGVNKVTVPGYYYKVLLDLTPPMKMVAFILPHKEGLSTDFWNYTVSVDSVETLTGIDFFREMNKELQEELESQDRSIEWGIKELLWDKSISSDNYTTSTNASEVIIKSQCMGIAKSTGQRCKITSTNEEGYCRYHTNQAN